MEYKRGLVMRILSVKRVDCDKTEERSVQIFIPYERSFSILSEKRERENFICHSNEQEYHTVETIQQNISTHVWQAARKGITPIELATLKKKEKKRTNLTSLYQCKLQLD